MGVGTEDNLDDTVVAGPDGEIEVRSVALSRPLIITALILATALSALDGTVVATALPTIVGVLGGLPLYPLVISAFLLTATTTVPVYGKLSDMYGRKPVFLAGSALFIGGSALCGLAWDMPSLIAFRAIQGIGAGAVLPTSLTIIGDLFAPAERARLQGVFSAVWGVSSVIGPLVGGAIVQFFDWRWVFFVNVPVGIFSGLLIFLYLREPHIHAHRRIDVAGATTLTGGVALIMVALQMDGHGSSWTSPPALLSLVGGLLLLVLFVAVERGAAAPILPLGLLARPMIAISSALGLLSGGILIGLSAYVPLLVQGAWGGTPIEAGLVIAPVSIGWPLASTASGRLFLRYGYRAVVIAGMVLLVVGGAVLLLLGLPAISDSRVLATAVVLVASFVSGAGFGLSATSMLVAVQSAVPWSERGIATAVTQFFRNMGNTVGAAVLGAVFTATLSATLASQSVQSVVKEIPAAALKPGSDPSLGPVNVLFDLSLRDTLPTQVRATLEGALAGSLWWVYFGMALLTVVGAFLAVRFPRSSPADS